MKSNGFGAFILWVLITNGAYASDFSISFTERKANTSTTCELKDEVLTCNDTKGREAHCSLHELREGKVFLCSDGYRLGGVIRGGK